MAKNKQQPKIAVIMPAYNAEPFLETSVRSILEQDGAEIRLYLVNDGSSDSTLTVAEDIQKTDERLICISVPNGGPAAARNRGLDEAFADEWADFVMFSDADDEYLPDAFRTAADAAENGAELVLMGFTIQNPDGTVNHYYEPDAVYTQKTLATAFSDLYKANLLNQVWGKLFSAALLRKYGFRFRDFRWGEDRLFIYDCLEKASAVCVVSKCTYLYKMYNSASLISGYYDKKPEVCKISDRRVRELCEKFGVTDDRYCRYMFLKSVFSCLTNLYSPSCRLTLQEKRAYADGILKDSYIQERIRGTGGGKAAQLLQRLMSTENVTMNLFFAKLLSWLSTKAPLYFQKLKHKK